MKIIVQDFTRSSITLCYLFKVGFIRGFFFFYVFSVIGHSAWAQQAAAITDPITWQVKIQEENSFDEEGLMFLKWSRNVYLVQNNGTKNYVAIHGKFREPVKQALLNEKPFPTEEDGSFHLKIVVTQEKKLRFNIFATSATTGREHRMQYTIASVNEKAVEIQPSRWRFSAGTGMSLISFRQRNVTPFNEWAMTIKGGATYRLVPDLWDIGLATFFNVIALSSDSPRGYKIQYLGVNLKAGYHLIDAPSHLRLTLSGGFYLNTSVSTVGFADMVGPQISPEVTYLFQNGHSLFWYGKFAYSFIGTHSSFFKDNREVATGIHYSFPVSLTNRLSIGVDLSQLSLSSAVDWASTNTYSLSGGLSF